MIEAGRADRVVALAVYVSFAAIALSSYESYTFLHGDGTFYANINKSLANDLSLDQRKYHPRSWLEADLGWTKTLDQGWSNVSLGADGRWLPKHSFVLPMFSTPFYVLLGLDGLLLFQVLMMAIAVYAAYRVAAMLLPRSAAAAAALIVAVQPIVAGDIYSYNNDAFYTALLMLGSWAFMEHRLVRAGLCFGVAVWAKATNALFVLPFALLVLWRRDPWAIARAALPFLAPVLMFGASNWALFGSPLTTSYQVILVREDGVLKTDSIARRFDEPMEDGLERILEHDFEGLNHKAPLLWLTLPGMLALLAYRETRAAAAAYAMILGGFVWLHCRYDFTYARFFLPVAALGVVPIGGLFRLAVDRQRRRAVGIGSAAVAIELTGWGLVRSTGGGGVYRLSDHVEEAAVQQGKEPCDYFNNARQKFECMSDSPRGHTFFWGRAMGDEQCVFGGEPKPMLWLHPPVGKRRRRTMTFDAVPRGETLVITYGLAETSMHDAVKLEVRINGTKVALPPIEKRGVLIRHTVAPSPLTKEQNILQIQVVTPPAHWRHLCLDAEVSQ